MNRWLLSLAAHTPWLTCFAIVATCVSLISPLQNPNYWLSTSQLYFAAAALALALTPIVLTGGIDLSVGSATVLSSVVIGFLWRDAGWPIELALAGGVAAGLLMGLVNGALVTVGVLPLVATLATRELFRGLALTLSGENPVQFPVSLGLRQMWLSQGHGFLPLIVFLVLFLVSYLMVHHTWVGRMLFAVGDNEQAARFAGLPVRRIKLGLYAWSGLVAGLCGAALAMHHQTAKPDAGKTLELTAIACVVLGGLRITGGAGHISGTLLGIITIVTLQAGSNIVVALRDWRDTITGALLIVVAIGNEAAARWVEPRQTGNRQ